MERVETQELRETWKISDETAPYAVSFRGPLITRIAALALGLALLAGASSARAETLDFGIGPAGGYIKARGADNGTWFAGAAARARIAGYFGAEASVTFHENEFLDGDVLISQVPVQLTAMFYPVPDWPVQPYALAGAGWYYTRIDYRHGLSGLDSETDHQFGYHVGAGASCNVGLLTLFADFRYIFLKAPGADFDDLRHKNFDMWQVAFGALLGF
jgi:opacity protein-like surface antigen